MNISKFQVRLVGMKPLNGNHYPMHNLELMVSRTLMLLDSMNTCPYSDKLDLNLHLNDILHSNRMQLKRMG